MSRILNVSPSGRQGACEGPPEAGWRTGATVWQPLSLQHACGGSARDSSLHEPGNGVAARRNWRLSRLLAAPKPSSPETWRMSRILAATRQMRLCKTLGWRTGATFVQPLRLRNRRFCDTFLTLVAGHRDNREGGMANVSHSGGPEPLEPPKAC